MIQTSFTLRKSVFEIDTEQWETLLRTSPTASWFQSKEAYDFYASLPDIFEPFVFAVESETANRDLENDNIVSGKGIRETIVNNLRALCVGYITKEKSKLKHFFTRRAIIIGGPLLAPDATQEEVSSLMQAIRNSLKHKAIYIETRNFFDYSTYRKAFEQAGFTYHPHLNFRVDTSSKSIIDTNLSRSRKRNIKDSIKYGAEYVTQPNIEDIRSFYILLQELYTSKVKTPLFPYSFFEKLYYMPHTHFLLVKYMEKIVGGTCCVELPNKALFEWFVCGLDGQHEHIYPSSLATYYGLLRANELGCSYFDLMGAGTPNESYGVRDFKARFGGELVEYGRYRKICNRLLYRIGTHTVAFLKRNKCKLLNIKPLRGGGKIQTVVIFGGHVQALGLARQVHNLGLRVILLLDNAYSIARFSRAVDDYYIYKDHNDLQQWLNTYAPQHDKDTLLFPTSDDMVEYLVKHYENLQQHFYIGIPHPQTVELFNNKRLAYQFAERHRIPCPKCWYPDTLEEVKALAKDLAYPVVVKPAVMYSFHKTFGKKAFKANSADELIAIYQRIADANYDLTTILIQQFLSGGPQHLYSYGVTAAEGKPLCYCIANRVRQNPMDFGNSTTFAITCDSQQIKRQTKRLLKLVKYTGMGEVEWMYDTASGQYLFLEINTRAWKWHTISNALGFSFIEYLINYYNQTHTPFSLNKQTVAWQECLTDFTVCAKEILHHREQNVKKYKYIKKEHAIWSWHAPLPALMYLLLSPILYVKRY